jgi:hypothetical protein
MAVLADQGPGPGDPGRACRDAGASLLQHVFQNTRSDCLDQIWPGYDQVLRVHYCSLPTRPLHQERRELAARGHGLRHPALPAGGQAKVGERERIVVRRLAGGERDARLHCPVYGYGDSLGDGDFN